MSNPSFEPALDYLAQKITKLGFDNSISSSKRFSSAEKAHTTFGNALILSCLNHLSQINQSEKLNVLRKQLSDLLVSQKSQQSSFNYWIRQTKHYTKRPYPDDLDDTFCSLEALYGFDKKLIDGQTLAQTVDILTSVEVETGGPYKTWLVDSTEAVWTDVDVVVNSNVASFLASQEVELENITKFVEKCIQTDQLKTPYYPDELVVIYFIARWYKGKLVPKLISKILTQQKKNNSWGNTFKTALAVSSLIRFNYSGDLQPAITYLQKKIYTPQQIKSHPICIDKIKNKTTYYLGSEYLTIAMMIEALALKKLQQPAQKNSDSVKSEFAAKIRQKVHQDVSLRIERLPQTIKKFAQKDIRQTLRADKDQQIVLLPFFFESSLKQRYRSSDVDFLSKLGAANLYGWMSYTIYDDFLDNEGKPEWLSLANVWLRELSQIYEHLFDPQHSFNRLFHQLLDEIDEANTWETLKCRFEPNRKLALANLKLPNYKSYQLLASKSIGHGLGPLAILYQLGYTQKTKEVKQFFIFLRSNLIARQLNDDAHDWIEDLKQGHINPVASLVLELAKRKNLGKKKLLHKKTLEVLNELFWDEVSHKVNRFILDHVEKSESALQDMTVLEDRSLLLRLLEPSKKAALKALEEQKKVHSFLKSYKD